MPDTTEGAKALAPPIFDLANAALFVDIDGTLLEIAERREDVRADDQIFALLRALEERTGGALAILTGRSLSDADRVLLGSVQCVAALHGLDCRLCQGTLRQPLATEAWSAAKHDLDRLVQAGALDCEVEDKGAAVALHYRSRPAQGPLIARAIDELAEKYALRALHGKMVSEIMPVGATKGVALSTLMQAPPFANRLPIAIGDDVTDEDAFRAANELGGASIAIGERRSDAARYALPSVTALRAWLRAALA